MHNAQSSICYLLTYQMQHFRIDKIGHQLKTLKIIARPLHQTSENCLVTQKVCKRSSTKSGIKRECLRLKACFDEYRQWFWTAFLSVAQILKMFGYWYRQSSWTCTILTWKCTPLSQLQSCFFTRRRGVSSRYWINTFLIFTSLGVP